MKNECSLVRDLLALYVEDMVSEETAAFVRAHLEHCPECAAELRREKPFDAAALSCRADDARAIAAMKKEIRKKKWRAVGVIVACLVLLAALVHYFPVYRYAEVGGTSYYSADEVAKLFFIGSRSDRAQAQAVLRKADQAFNDVQHTREENKAAYGLLARYATPTDSYGDTAFNVHSLELWSAHLGEDEGWLWVYYSSKTYEHGGDIACASSNVPSLWRVEKNGGEWVVVQIREHP